MVDMVEVIIPEEMVKLDLCPLVVAAEEEDHLSPKVQTVEQVDLVLSSLHTLLPK